MEENKETNNKPLDSKPEFQKVESEPQGISSQPQVTQQPEMQPKVKDKQSVEVKPKKELLIPILLILLLIVFVITAYLGYQYYKSTMQSDKQKEETPIVFGEDTPTATTSPTENWGSYTIEVFNLSFKLPPELDVDKLTKTESPGEKGMTICWTFPREKVGLVSHVIAGGQCSPNRFGVTTISSDFEVGRMSAFQDTKGYVVEDGSIYYIGMTNKRTLLPSDLAKLINNQNGIEILRVKGATDHDENSGTNFPVQGTPGEGVMGAIILTDSEMYPAISVEMDIDEILTENTFDQILSTFKFINEDSEIVNWKTYSDNTYDYKFPTTWRIYEDNNGDVIYGGEDPKIPAPYQFGRVQVGATDSEEKNVELWFDTQERSGSKSDPSKVRVFNNSSGVELLEVNNYNLYVQKTYIFYSNNKIVSLGLNFPSNRDSVEGVYKDMIDSIKIK